MGYGPLMGFVLILKMMLILCNVFVNLCVDALCTSVFQYSNTCRVARKEKEFISVTCLIKEDGNSLCVACSYCPLPLWCFFSLSALFYYIFLLFCIPPLLLYVIVVVVMVGLIEPVLCVWGFYWIFGIFQVHCEGVMMVVGLICEWFSCS